MQIYSERCQWVRDVLMLFIWAVLHTIKVSGVCLLSLETSVVRFRGAPVFSCFCSPSASVNLFPSRSAVLLRLRIDPYLCLMQFGTDGGYALRIPDKPAGVKVDPALWHREKWVNDSYCRSRRCFCLNPLPEPQFDCGGRDGVQIFSI